MEEKKDGQMDLAELRKTMIGKSVIKVKLMTDSRTQT